MTWNGAFDWRQDSTVFARKWLLYIRPDNMIHVATAVVLDYGTQVVLHNDGFTQTYAEAVIPVRDQGDRDTNIQTAKALAEKLVKALYE